MIPKGNPHDDAGALGRYLFKTDPGEHATIHEVKGFGINEMTGAERAMMPREVVAALKTIETIAAGTKAQQPFFHFYVRIGDEERLSDAQWQETAYRMKAAVGLDGQPHVVAFHENELTGAKHMHVAVSRIDAERMKAINLHQPIKKMMHVARELEREYGLRELSSTRDIGEPQAPSRGELEEARRMKLDERALRREIRHALEHSDSAQAFVHALAAHEMVLTNGTRRDCMVVVDREGGHHALNKKLLGLGAAQIRQRLSDIERSQLEDAETVSRRMKQERLEERERAQSNATVGAAYYSRDEETAKRELAMLEAADRSAPERARRIEHAQYVQAREASLRAQMIAGASDHAVSGLARHLEKETTHAARQAGEGAARAARAAQHAAFGIGRKVEDIGHAGAPLARGAERIVGRVVDSLTDLVTNAGRYERQEQEAQYMSNEKRPLTPAERAADQDRRNPLTVATPDVENKLRYHQNPNDVALQQLRWHIENARREREAAAERERGQDRERGRER